VKPRAACILALLFAAAFWTGCSSSRPSSRSSVQLAVPDSPELLRVRRMLDSGIDHQAAGRYVQSQTMLSGALSELSMIDTSARQESMRVLARQILAAMKNNLPYSLDPESIEDVEYTEEDGLALLDSIAPDEDDSSLDSASARRLWNEVLADSLVVYDLPVEINDMVLLHLRTFKERIPSTFARWLERKGKWEDMILQELSAAGLPRDLLYLSMIESGFNPRATSPAAAAGIWQFIPSTGRRFGLRIDRYVDERRDPVKATRAAIQYLSFLYQMYGDWRLAMASYNCGEACVGRAVRRAGHNDYWNISLPRETRHYVPKVFAAAILGKNPVAHGFVVRPWAPIVYDTFAIEGGLTFEQIGNSLGVPAESLAVLNPALTRGTTPPVKESWVLHLPVGTRDRFAAVAGDLERSYKAPEPQKFAYKVRRKESLASIAARYGVPVSDLKRWNRISSRTRTVRAGRRLVIWGDMPGVGVAVKEPPLRSSGDGIPERKTWNVKTHKVRRGDTYTSIARRYGVTVEQLASWNGIPNGRLKAGRRVTVSDPAAGLSDQPALAGLPRRQAAPAVAEPEREEVAQAVAKASVPAAKDVERPRYHRVHRGETLSSIAGKFGLGVSDLKTWNRLSSDRVRPGQRLLLHGRASAPVAQKHPEARAAASREHEARVVRVPERAEPADVSRHHRVRAGETLESIARQHGVAVSSLKLLNRLRTSRILVGQKLTLPAAVSRVESHESKPAPAPKAHTTSGIRTVRYVVREGDSLYSIARARSTTVDSIIQLNGLRGSSIRPGQVLEIPTVASL